MHRVIVVMGAILVVTNCASASADRPDTTDRAVGNAFYTFAFETDIPSYDLKHDPDNVTYAIDLNAHFGAPAGSPVTIHGTYWNVLVEAFAPSSLWSLYLELSGEPVGSFTVLFIPGASHQESGVLATAGGATFADVGISDLVLPNGILHLQFFHAPDTFPDAPDGVWRGGEDRHITFDVTVLPGPGAASLLAIAFAPVARRRR